MNPNKICSDCYAWKKNKGGENGECRLNAPALLSLEDKRGYWPWTEPTDGCMSFRRITEDHVPGERAGRTSAVEADALDALRRTVLAKPQTFNAMHRMVQQFVPVRISNFHRLIKKFVAAGLIEKIPQPGGVYQYSLPTQLKVEPPQQETTFD